MKHLLQAHGIKVVNNQIAKADVEKAISIIATAGKYDKLSEKEQLELVKSNGLAIKHIKSPSEAVQLEAVKENSYAIQYIKSPSEEVQLVAVKKDSDAIRYIKNPSEEVQLVAVKKDGSNIFYIKNPSEELKLAAVKENSYAIQYIKSPSEEVQLVAVKKDGCVIKFIKDPSEEVQLAAVKNFKKDIDSDVIIALKKIKKPIDKIKELISGRLDLNDVWNMFPSEFRKKFKDINIDFGILSAESKKMFYNEDEDEKCHQLIFFSEDGDVIEVSTKIYGQETDLHENLGKYNLKDKQFVDKVIKAVETIIA